MENTTENKAPAEKSFEIGGIKFTAIRTMRPCPHWRFRLDETGEVFEPGTGGISNESVPKMQADIQYLLDRISKDDTADFRRRFGLPPDAGAYETHIKIAADSIALLRKADVFRVLEDVQPRSTDGVTRASLAGWISVQRPDLAEEVKETVDELA